MIKKRQLQRCCSSYVNILFILTINQLEWLPDVSVYENLSPNIVHYDGKKREKKKTKKHLQMRSSQKMKKNLMSLLIYFHS